jgi:hypothetical protein
MGPKLVCAMSARCHWWWGLLVRRCGVMGLIVVGACALALAGSPQSHELVHHASARVGHAYTITLSKAGKRLKAIELVKVPNVIAPVIVMAKHRAITRVWVLTPFLEACQFEHAPPAPL